MAARYAQSPVSAAIRALVAKAFRNVWRRGARDELEAIAEEFSDSGYWPDGWASVKSTLFFDAKDPGDSRTRLLRLERKLAPASKADRALAYVVNMIDDTFSPDIDSVGDIHEQIIQRSKDALELGKEFSGIDELLPLVPLLVRQGRRVREFANGYAQVNDVSAAWDLLAAASAAETGPKTSAVFCGLLQGLEKRHASLADELVDRAFNDIRLAQFFPDIQCSINITEVGIARLKTAISRPEIPVWNFTQLWSGARSDGIPTNSLHEMLRLLLDRENGHKVAVEILGMVYFSRRQDGVPIDQSLVASGKMVLAATSFDEVDDNEDYKLAELARVAFADDQPHEEVTSILDRILEEASGHRTYLGRHHDLLSALLQTQPFASLDSLVGKQLPGWAIFEDFDDSYRHNPANILDARQLSTWCDLDPGMRYPWAATIVPLDVRMAEDQEKEYQRTWSSLARVLLDGAPDKIAVLEKFVDRARPSGWSGSLATILESRIHLFGELAGAYGAAFDLRIVHVQAALAAEATKQRAWEDRDDRERDERFE